MQSNTIPALEDWLSPHRCTIVVVVVDVVVAAAILGHTLELPPSRSKSYGI